jgi:hypothetical protein
MKIYIFKATLSASSFHCTDHRVWITSNILQYEKFLVSAIADRHYIDFVNHSGAGSTPVRAIKKLAPDDRRGVVTFYYLLGILGSSLPRDKCGS